MAGRKAAPHDAELIESKKWGVPSWKSKNKYPDWKILSLDQKRWEFLRRTKEYRSDWARAENAEKSQPIKTSNKFSRPFDKKSIARRYGISHAVPPQHDYKDLPKEFKFTEQPVYGGEIIYPRPKYYQELKRKQRTQELTCDEEIALLAEKDHLRLLTPPKDWHNLCAWVEFDFSQNLDDQLATAKINLQKARKEAKAFMDSLRNPEDKYDPYDYAPHDINDSTRTPRGPNQELMGSEKVHPDIVLLRVLDAKNCGRRNEEIAVDLGELIGKYINPSTISKNYSDAELRWKRLKE